MHSKKFSLLVKFLTAFTVLGGALFADEHAAAEASATSHFAMDTIVMFICAVLVLFMQAGFAMVEAGFNSAKNTVNILFKNMMDLSVGVLLFYLVGWGIMYPGFAEGSAGIFAFAQVGIGFDNPDAVLNGDVDFGYVHPQVDFLFQVAFAATAATIVSGAVAGRMKVASYLIYSAILTGIIYPISGAWKWGGGWLDGMGFHDFAGSGIVHMVGGFAGLAGAIVLGPRIGRFSEGKSVPIPGHNIAMATLGVFILWIGWYGFNPGSVLAAAEDGEAGLVGLVAVNTTLAAALGAIAAMLLGWVIEKKPNLEYSLNGALGGLVAITANADVVTNGASLVIGFVGGVCVVIGIKLLETLKIDDPVGAWPVHGLAGVWGVLATGLFGSGKSFGTQVIGTLTYMIWPFVTMFILFTILKAAGILRVSEEDEMKGLDISEHGSESYSS